MTLVVVSLMCAIAPARAFAEDEVIHYMGKDGNTCEIATSDVIDITNMKYAPGFEGGKTYLISEDRKEYGGWMIQGRIQAKGSATFILARSVHFASGHGIHCSKGNALTIAGQLDHPELAPGEFATEFGELPMDKEDAFIGGDDEQSAGEIAICGCTVNADTNTDGAAIGGGECGDGGRDYHQECHGDCTRRLPERCNRRWLGRYAC